MRLEQRERRHPATMCSCWAVCDRMGVPVLLSEDLQDGRTLGGVMFVDPFGDRMARFLTI